MAFSNIKKDGHNKLTFDIADLDISIVNAIRRIILSEIPTIALAFDPISDKNPDITITTNKSPLHNEFFAHRLSLIPMHFDAETIDTYNPDDYVFKLKVKNTGTDIMSITTKDIKIYDSKAALYPESFHEKIFPKDPITKKYILITKLRPNIYYPDKGEEVDVIFKGSKNIAKAHSRWSSVSCCALSNKIDEELVKKAFQKTLDDLKKQKGEELTPKEVEAVSSKFVIEKYRHYVKNKYGEASEFHFKIESECALLPTYIFGKALDILIAKLENVRNIDLDIRVIQENQKFYNIIFVDEDYTLLNVLQCMIYNNEIRGNPATPLEYIGYYQPHPLDNKMIMKIKFDNQKDLDVGAFVKDCIKVIIDNINTVKDAWQTK